NSYLVTATDVTRNVTRVLNYSTVERATLNAGNFADSVTVQSTLLTTPVYLNMGGGDDSVLVQNAAQTLADLQAPVQVDGQGGSDQLTVNDQGTAAGSIPYTIHSVAVF